VPAEDGGHVNEFERAAGDQRKSNLLTEFWMFLRQDKKWWLAPVIAVILFFGLLVFLSGTAVAPFIYTLF
jgi:hypothetical protein